MIEPPKLAVFLFVVTAHLAVLAFGFPSLSPAPEESSSQSASTSLSTTLAEVDQASALSGFDTAGNDVDEHRTDGAHDHAYGHGAAPRSSDPPEPNNPSATRAGHQRDSDGPVDTVPTFEDHRRQHGHSDHEHDHDNEPQLVDLERIAQNDKKPKDAEKQDAGADKNTENEKPAPTQLAVAQKPPSLKWLPAVADESAPDVPARPTPVQMITAEKPVAKSTAPQPNLKPVAKPSTTPSKAKELPPARPVANTSTPAAPTSNRAGSARMKNLRPIKKP
jgi:hypothetical protein